MLKSVLLIISLSFLAACGEEVPEPPGGYQFAYRIKEKAFFGVHNKTGERLKLDRDDPLIENAQCMTAMTYLEFELWVDKLKELARKRCQ